MAIMRRPVLFHACGECIGVYNCPNKKVDAVVAYTNTVPAGAFRGYGLPQTLFAVEAAIDELAQGSSASVRSRFAAATSSSRAIRCCRRRAPDITTCIYGSYGLDQCLDLVERAMQAEAPKADLSADWLIGEGIALTMIDTVPPDGHIADATISLREDGGFELTVGTAEFGNGTCDGASPDRRDRARDHRRSDPPQAIRHRAWRPRHRRLWLDRHLRRRARDAGGGGKSRRRDQGLCFDARPGTDRDACVLENDSVGLRQATPCRLRNSPKPRAPRARRCSASGTSAGTPRSVAFNVQGFRVAVNKGTGEIKILKSVQAADAGRVANPMQCRGQVEGGVAQSLGATLYEEMVIDESGRVVNPKFRDYHLPSFADVPRTEVLFADTCDTIGPMGAKSMSESPYNPVAAAIGNAIADATGIRFTSVPFKPDRLWPQLQEKFGS